MGIINELNSRPCMDCTQWAALSGNIIPVDSVQDYFQHRLKLLELKRATGREANIAFSSNVHAIMAARIMVRKDIGKLEVLKNGTPSWQEIVT